MTTIALRHACKNSISTIAVSKIPSPRLCTTPASDAWVYSAGASTSVNWTCGYFFSIVLSWSRAISVDLISSEETMRLRSSRTVGALLNREM